MNWHSFVFFENVTWHVGLEVERQMKFVKYTHYILAISLWMFHTSTYGPPIMCTKLQWNTFSIRFKTNKNVCHRWYLETNIIIYFRYSFEISRIVHLKKIETRVQVWGCGFRCVIVVASTVESQFQETHASSQSHFETSNLESNIHEDDDDVRSGICDDHLSSKIDLIASSLLEFDSYKDPCAYSRKKNGWFS